MKRKIETERKGGECRELKRRKQRGKMRDTVSRKLKIYINMERKDGGYKN